MLCFLGFASFGIFLIWNKLLYIKSQYSGHSRTKQARSTSLEKKRNSNLALQHVNLHSATTPNRSNNSRTFQQSNLPSTALPLHKPTTTTNTNGCLPLHFSRFNCNHVGNNLPNSLRQSCRSFPKQDTVRRKETNHDRNTNLRKQKRNLRPNV